LLDDLLTHLRAVGADGLARMAAEPGLVAAVDQHAARIRDALAGVRLSPRTLGEYLAGFGERAVERGWWPEETDWATVHVIAICLLIESAAP
jgi:hypothetical protein